MHYSFQDKLTTFIDLLPYNEAVRASLVDDGDELLTEQMKSFILQESNEGALTSENMARRFLFLESLFQQAGVDFILSLQSHTKPNEGTASNRTVGLVHQILTHPNIKNDPSNTLLSNIDEGIFPRNHIANLFGVKQISSNQLKTAIRLVSSGLVNKTEHAFLCAKLPSQWYMSKNDKGESLPFFHPSIRRGRDANLPLSFPFFMNAARHIGELDHLTATTSPEAHQAIKKQKKLIAREFEWLASGKDILDSIAKLSERYNAENELKDYFKFVNGQLRTILYRCAYEAARDSFTVNQKGHAEFSIDALIQSLADNKDISPDALDIKDFSQQDLFSLDSTYAIKSCYKKSRQLHKNFTRINQLIDSHNKTTLSWVGLIDEPVSINGFAFKPITDSKQLLHEGEAMSHCVYSYLQDCISGKTSILTIRTNEDDAVATLEIGQEFDGEHHVHTCKQVLGFENDPVPQSVQDATDALINKLNAGEIKPNDVAFENMAQKELPESLEYAIETTNEDFRGITGLAYTEAYAILKEFLPDSVSISSLFDSLGKDISALLESSKLGRHILLLEALEHHKRGALIPTHTIKPITSLVGNIELAISNMTKAISQTLNGQRLLNNFEDLYAFTKLKDTCLESNTPTSLWVTQNKELFDQGLTHDEAVHMIELTQSHTSAESATKAFIASAKSFYRENQALMQESINALSKILPSHKDIQRIKPMLSENASKNIDLFLNNESERQYSQT